MGSIFFNAPPFFESTRPNLNEMVLVELEVNGPSAPSQSNARLPRKSVAAVEDSWTISSPQSPYMPTADAFTIQDGGEEDERMVFTRSSVDFMRL
jgi:hypothetical protein